MLAVVKPSKVGVLRYLDVWSLPLGLEALRRPQSPQQVAGLLLISFFFSVSQPSKNDLGINGLPGKSEATTGLCSPIPS
jgi:hypothetical protein